MHGGFLAVVDFVPHFVPRQKMAQKKATVNTVTYCFCWSGREDLNLRLPAPKAGALPDCATPRFRALHIMVGKPTQRQTPIRFVRDGIAFLHSLPAAGALVGCQKHINALVDGLNQLLPALG
jgi:hypothetical protein